MLEPRIVATSVKRFPGADRRVVTEEGETETAA